MQRPGLALALVGLLAALPGRLDASDSYRLMPAQLVTRSEGLPSLRLAASGPIAFQVLTPEESGQPAAPNQLAVRLYGVGAEEFSAGGIAPYTVTARAVGNDTILTISLAADATIDLRTGRRSNELEVVASPR